MGRSGAFELTRTYVHLSDGPEATPIEVTDDFWATIDRRPELAQGRLVTAHHFHEDWPHWERHPEGDEIVFLLEGAMSLVLDEPEGERVVELRGPSACLVPRGVWHRGIVREPTDAVFITRGKGTEHRPLRP